MLLINAVRTGRVMQVRFLLKAGIELDRTDEHGKTALLHSCFLKHDKTRMTVVRLLVTWGASLSKRDKRQRSVFLWACRLGHVDVLNYLLENPRSVELEFSAKDRDGNNPLTLAVMSQNLKVVKTVLKLMRNLSLLWEFKQVNNAGICPLVQAFIQGDQTCAKILIKEGVSDVSNIVQFVKKRIFESSDTREDKFINFDAVIFKLLENSIKVQTRSEKVNEKHILELLFTNREKILALKTKNHVKNFFTRQTDVPLKKPPTCTITSSKRQNSVHLKTRSLEECSKKTVSEPNFTETSQIQRRKSMNPRPRYLSFTDCSEPLRFRGHVNQTCSEFTACNMKARSSSLVSFKMIMELYTQQCSKSFRKGLPSSKNKSISPSTPPRHERMTLNSESDLFQSSFGIPSFDEFPESPLESRLRNQFARSVRSSSLNTTRQGSSSNLFESAFDKHMRRKYSREMRSSSLQFPNSRYVDVSENALSSSFKNKA